MKRGFLTVLLSVLAGGITAYAVVKATEPKTVEGGYALYNVNARIRLHFGAGNEIHRDLHQP